jgi:hypothetical protein
MTTTDKQILDTVEEIKFKLEGFENNQERILLLLSGNPINSEDRGLVGKVSRHEKRISVLEKTKDRVWHYLLAGCFIIGAGWGVVKLAIELFIKK